MAGCMEDLTALTSSEDSAIVDSGAVATGGSQVANTSNVFWGVPWTEGCSLGAHCDESEKERAVRLGGNHLCVVLIEG